jgi:putative serine protease PepD
MDPDEEQPQGPGDELDDDGPGASWLHPDDRLWRHPSEVGANPSVGASGGGARPVAPLGRRWVQSVQARIWLVGVISGAVGALLCAGVLLATGVVGTNVEVPSSTPTTVSIVTTSALPAAPDATAIFDMVEPSIVGLTVNGAQGEVVGSGVIVETNGDQCYVLTDSALFAEAGPNSQVQVSSYAGQQQKGSLLGTDPSAGIAVVRVSLPPLSSLDPANLGSVADIQTGEQVFSVGSSAMAGSSDGSEFTPGYIDDTASYLQPANGGSDAMFSMLVADMSVGASADGGALVDGNGQLLGILNSVSGQLAQAGLTYVTPIDTAMADVYSMIKNNGHAAPHPWLGILQATDMSGPWAQHLGLAGGVQVDSVASGSPAAKEGMSDNDVVLSVGGRSVSSVGALIALLANAKPGQVVSVGWLHAGHRRKADITLGTQPASATES